MSEEMGKDGLKDVLESFNSCARAASDFTREYKKLSRKFNALEASLEEAREKGTLADRAVESINDSAKSLEKFSDSIPELAKRLNAINESIKQSKAVFDDSEDNLTDFRENLGKFKEITDEIEKFSNLAERLDPDEMEKGYADTLKKINNLFDRNKSDIVSLSNQVSEFRKALRDMRTEIKEFNQGMKGYTKETDRQLKELVKIAGERSDISFHTHVDVNDSVVEEVVAKAAGELNRRIELGEKETKEVLLGDDLVNKIASSSAGNVVDAMKGKVYSEEDFRPGIIREVISIMLEREKKKLKKAEDRSREREEELARSFEERLSALKQEMIDEISNIHIDAPPPQAKVEITGATLLPELSRLIGMQQDSYLEKLKDFIKTDVTEALDKKLHELDIVPEPRPELHSLKELREIHGKFPFDVIDYTDEEKTKFQIRKFEDEKAHVSVYLAEGKKVKVDDRFDIKEKKYMEIPE